MHYVYVWYACIRVYKAHLRLRTTKLRLYGLEIACAAKRRPSDHYDADLIITLCNSSIDDASSVRIIESRRQEIQWF